MERQHIFPDVMLQIAIAAVACMLFNIPDQAKGGIPFILYILLFAFAIISYLCERLFLRQSKSLPVAAVFNFILIFAGMAVAFILHQITGVATGLFLGIVFLVLSGMAFRETSKGINVNTLTLCFDVLAVLLLIYILFVELGSGKLTAALPGAVGLVASFIGIMVLRDSSRIGARDRLFSVLIIVFIVAVAFLVYLLAGDPLRDNMKGILTWIGEALAWIGHILKEILLFFSRLFPEQQYENVEMDLGGDISMPGGEGGEEPALSPLPLIILGGVLLIVIIVVTIVVFRKHQFSKRTVSSVKQTEREQRKRISLWNALRIWAKDKIYRFKVRVFFLQNRHTPAGRFYRLVSSLKHSRHALRQGETPREFLNRYIASLQPGDKRIPELTALIRDLNVQLYR